jgi:hypothetical protein
MCLRPVPLQEGPLWLQLQYSIKAEDYETKPLFVASKENRLLNEFFLYVLEDLHTTQGLGALQFTSADPAIVMETVKRVYPLIPATATAPETRATRAFSRQLVAYIEAFLPAAPYFKSNDGRISTVCDDQYSSTLAMLEETADEAFKVFMTHKTQGWSRGWGCPRPSDAAASSGPGATPGGAGAARPARPPASAASDDAESFRSHLKPSEGATIRRCRQQWTWRRCHPGAGRWAHAIQDFETSARSSHRPSSPRQEGILTLKFFMFLYPKLCYLVVFAI